MIQVSWIIPLYRGKKYIPNIMDNMLEVYEYMQDIYHNMKYNMEVLLINDDPSESIELHEYPFAVRLIQHQNNMGIHQARITGLHAAQGEFVIFLDQDDHVAPSFLVRQLKEINSADVCVANGYREYPNDKKLLYSRKSAIKLTGKYNVYLYGTDMIFSSGQCLIRKSSIPKSWQQIIMKTNGCDDFLLWILMLKENARFNYLWEPLFFHRETEYNCSNDYSQMDNSFKEMIDILVQSNAINVNEIKVLRKRLYIKQIKRKNKSMAIFKMMMSPKIIYYTIKYKLSGYQ